MSQNVLPAVSHGHTDVVELLVSKGAEVNRMHSVSGWTCLHQAAYKVGISISTHALKQTVFI